MNVGILNASFAISEHHVRDGYGIFYYKALLYPFRIITCIETMLFIAHNKS